MNLFNRLLVLLLALLLLAGSGATWLALSGILTPEHLALAPWLGDWAAYLTALEPGAAVGAMALSLLLILLSLTLIIAELLPERREARLVLKQDATGSVTVAFDSVREIVSRAALAVEGVQDVRARVTRAANGLRVDCRVSVDPSARLTELTRELQEQIQAAVEHHLGQSVAEISVEVHLAAPIRA